MMRRMVLLGMLLCALRVDAQDAGELELFACYDKTVNIIFPYAVVSEDHGSRGIIVQQRKGADHILHIKANQRNFAPTSLSVVTSDGNFYSFVVRYVDDVYRMNYVIDSTEAVTFTVVSHNERVLQEEREAIAEAPSNLHKKVRNGITRLRLSGLYVSPHALWLRAAFTNGTSVPFAAGFIKFFIRDVRRTKNAAVQEHELFPIYQQALSTFKGTSNNPLVFAFDPFVVNKHQQLVMQVGEMNGNGFIQLQIRPKYFRRAALVH